MPARSGSCAASLVVGLVLTVAGCGGGSSSTPQARSTLAPSPPQIAQFLELPVARPASCPASRNGTASGRVSPWTSHVDVSIFLRTRDSAATVRSLGHRLRDEPSVLRVYFESQREAHEEFARLYTCSDSVPLSATPSSYRVVLRPGTTTATRNALVSSLLADPAVQTESCDPSNPCVALLTSPSSSP